MKNPTDINAAKEDPRDQALHAGVHEGAEPTGDSPVSENSMGAVEGDYDAKNDDKPVAKKA